MHSFSSLFEINLKLGIDACTASDFDTENTVNCFTGNGNKQILFRLRLFFHSNDYFSFVSKSMVSNNSLFHLYCSSNDSFAMNNFHLFREKFNFQIDCNARNAGTEYLIASNIFVVANKILLKKKRKFAKKKPSTSCISNGTV